MAVYPHAMNAASSLSSSDVGDTVSSFPTSIYVAVMCVVHVLVLLFIFVLAGIEWCRMSANSSERKRQCDELEARVAKNAEALRFQERFCSIVNSPDVFGNMVESPTASVRNASPSSLQM